MRQNFAADWAFGIVGAIEKLVRSNAPQHLRQWPLMRAFDFEAYQLGRQHACIILRDKLSGIPAGPGDFQPFPYSGLPPLPPKIEDLEIWQDYLRSKFELRNEDAAVVFPIHDSGKRAPEDYDLFSAEEKCFWNKQLRYICARYKAHLDTFQSSSPPQSVNITYNVSGQNTRVNIASTDSSTNIIDQPSTNVFGNLMGAAASIQNDAKRVTIETAIREMQESYGTESFADKYKRFMSVIADHITVFAPMLPALSALL